MDVNAIMSVGRAYGAVRCRRGDIWRVNHEWLMPEQVLDRTDGH